MKALWLQACTDTHSKSEEHLGIYNPSTASDTARHGTQPYVSCMPRQCACPGRSKGYELKYLQRATGGRGPQEIASVPSDLPLAGRARNAWADICAHLATGLTRCPGGMVTAASEHKCTKAQLGGRVLLGAE